MARQDDSLPPPPAIPAGLEELLPQFVAEMARDCTQLQVLAAGERALLAEHAHAMRGKCGMFGEELLFDLLSRLEEGAAHLDGEGVSTLVAHIVARTMQLREYV